MRGLEQRRCFVAALCALPLSACASTIPNAQSDARDREAPAPHLRTAADGKENPRAPTARDVATPGANQVISLRHILGYADQHSPVLSVARSTRSRAEAERVAASIVLPSNPELTVAAGPRFNDSGTGVDFRASVVQQLQIGGERGKRVEAAKRLQELTESEIEQIRWNVHCDVHAEFHRALVEQERARLAERVVSFQEEVLKVVKRQISAGETAALTVRLAEAEVAQARQVLVSAKQAFVASRIRLSQLSGWPVATPPMPAGSLDVARDPPSVDQLSAVAYKRLPSLRVGAARVGEAQARATAAEREAWPRPSLGVEYQREGSTSGEDPTNILMGVVSLPIPAFQKNQGERARTRADVTVAEAELEASRRLLEGQIAQARSDVVAAAARAKAYGTEILPRFEENLVLLRRSFELGEIDILSLSTGRERFLRIQSDALLAQQDYFVALAGLERVVGVDLWHDDHEGTDTP